MKKAKRIPWSVSGRTSIRNKLAELKVSAASLFHYPKEKDLQILDYVLIPGATLQWRKENPVWFQLIGSPGSGKTQHIMLYEGWENALMISRLTKNSLISGFRPDGDVDEDPSLLKVLDGKLFIVKDFTCILQGPKEERDSVIGQLRDIYDGTASRSFGNIGLQEYSSRFNMLLAVTNIIDGFHGVNSQLGERFVSRREYSVHRERITEAAFDNIVKGRKDSQWEDLKAEFHEFLSVVPRMSVKDIEWPLDMKRRAIAAAQFTATARSHVIRERDGRSIATRPSPEVGSRLVTQLVQTVVGHCILNGKKLVTQESWDFGGAQLLRDTLSTSISWTLFQMKKATEDSKRKVPTFTVRDLLPMTRLGFNTTEQIIANLHHNGILGAKHVGRTGRRSTEYYITDLTMDTLEFTRYFEGYSDEEVDIETLKQRLRSRERDRKRIEENGLSTVESTKDNQTLPRVKRGPKIKR